MSDAGGNSGTNGRADGDTDGSAGSEAGLSTLSTQGLGLAGVVGFSLTLPVTRYAVPAFGPELVGPGRALLAALIAVLLLVVLRRPVFPPRRSLVSVVVVAIGSVVGFPLLTAHALKSVSASHAAVMIAFLPAATAVMATARAREKPTLVFWAWCGAGTALIAGYLALGADSQFGAGDVELILAVLLCALGYAEGGVLSREAPGWLVTCWSLIIGFPAVLAIVLVTGLPSEASLTWRTVGAFLYLAVGSSLIAFFCWYRALAAGGVAKVGQIQLLQPILTMLFASLLLDEPLNGVMLLVGLGVGGTVLMAQRTRVPAAPAPAAAGATAGSDDSVASRRTP
ncbi:DMT family transporter [Streptomyces odontomachi]|uniref:DMT family transporter n=1 Tax=Streptomyces odontomachi TaxID=2944940 RepID=UPI00210A0BAF|nr:DMT family transporter [Streptomyces sp. ODS25]